MDITSPSIATIALAGPAELWPLRTAKIVLQTLYPTAAALPMIS
jgi:hypothetical protein